MSVVGLKLDLSNHVLARKYLNLFLPDPILREACQLHDREYLQLAASCLLKLMGLSPPGGALNC